MPLAKLQRFGEGRRTSEDRFIYDFSWREEAGRQAVSRPGFDDTGTAARCRRMAGPSRPAHPASRSGQMGRADRRPQQRSSRLAADG